MGFSSEIIPDIKNSPFSFIKIDGKLDILKLLALSTDSSTFILVFYLLLRTLPEDHLR